MFKPLSRFLLQQATGEGFFVTFVLLDAVSRDIVLLPGDMFSHSGFHVALRGFPAEYRDIEIS